MSISIYMPKDTEILHTAYADFVSRQIGRPVHIVQYDDSLPILAVKLFSDGQAYMIPQNANINIRLNKPDGTYIYNPALGCSEDRHSVYFEITPQMTAYAGESSPIIEIDYEGSVAASSSIGIVIDRNPFPNDEIESSNEYKSIAKYAGEAVSAAASASASRSAAEISESHAKESEINAKQSDDAAKMSMNTSVISKNDAEAAAKRAETAALAASAAADEAVGIEWSYAVCSTAMDVAAKTVSIAKFALATGTKVTIKFQNGNSAGYPTLNVSGTGAKAIYYNGEIVSKEHIKKESVHELVYDGAHWLLEGGENEKKSCVTLWRGILYDNISNAIFYAPAQYWHNGNLTLLIDCVKLENAGMVPPHSKTVMANVARRRRIYVVEDNIAKLDTYSAAFYDDGRPTAGIIYEKFTEKPNYFDRIIDITIRAEPLTTTDYTQVIVHKEDSSPYVITDIYAVMPQEQEG